jgi:hypothetical protein
MVGLLLRRIAEYLSVVLVWERHTAQSGRHVLCHIGGAAPVDHCGHIDAAGNAVVINGDGIGRNAHLRDVSKANLLPGRGINT